MVAVASPVAAATVGRARGWGWTIAAGAVVILGLLVRLALGGGGVGDRSAVVMAFLLTLCAWLAARLLLGQRAALLVVIAGTVLFDLAALPARSITEYDDVQAFYRTDQVLSAQLPLNGQTEITVLAQPVFAGTQPTFRLAGEVNGSSREWDCAFQRGVQRLVLPLPMTVRGATAVDIQLRLTGTPSRESDYLLVYQSSRQGGFLIDAGPPSGAATTCALR